MIILNGQQGNESIVEDQEDVTIHPPSEGQFADLCAKLHHLDLLVISEEIFTEILFDQVCITLFPRTFYLFAS